MYHLIINLSFREKIVQHPLNNTPTLTLEDSITVPLLVDPYSIVSGIELIKRAVAEHFECREGMKPTGLFASIAQRVPTNAIGAARVYWKQLRSICNELNEVIGEGYLPTWHEVIEVSNLQCGVQFMVVRHGDIINDFTSNTGFINLQAAINANSELWMKDGLTMSVIPPARDMVLIFNNKEQMDTFVHVIKLMAPFNKVQVIIRNAEGTALTAPAVVNHPSVYIRAGCIDNDKDVNELAGFTENLELNEHQLESGVRVYFSSEVKDAVDIVSNLEYAIGFVLSENNYHGDTYRRVVTKESYPLTRRNSSLRPHRLPLELFSRGFQ